MTVVVDPRQITIPPQLVAMQMMELKNCVCEALAEFGGGELCWCGLYPGQQVSWEYCGECAGDVCGMAYVRLAGVFPYDVFPEAVIDQRCVRPLAWEIEVGALRCIPQRPDGEPLDQRSMNEVALHQINDAYAIYWAMRCCGIELAVGSYVPVGPEGGCVGGFWTAFLPIT
jgi:hypothetical protein